MSASYYLEEYEPPPVSIWQRINRFLWVVLTLAIVALIIGAFLPELDKQRDERQKHDDLARAIKEQRALLARNKNKIGWLTNDPEYLAIFARDKLDKQKEGETVLRMEPPKPAAIQPEPAPPPAGQPARGGKGKALN